VILLPESRNIRRSHIILIAVSSLVLLSLPASTLAGRPSPPREESDMSFTISSPSFSSGGTIPTKFTCSGADVSPELRWNDPPGGTKSFALLVDDPDAPVGNWNHWTAWNLPANLRALPEGFAKDARVSDGVEQGNNDFHRTGYNGPCPPPGKPHRYYFKLFALDSMLNLKAGAMKRDLESAMKGHILAQAEWMGRFWR